MIRKRAKRHGTPVVKIVPVYDVSSTSKHHR